MPWTFDISCVVTEEFVSVLCNPKLFYVLAAALVAMAVYKKTKPSKTTPLPPGPRRYPVLGSLTKLSGDEMFYVKLNELRRRHGDVIYFTLGSLKMLAVFGHDKVDEVLGNKMDTFKFRPVWLVEITSMSLSNGIVWSNGLDNAKLREFALPAFHPGVGGHTLEERVQIETRALVSELQRNTPSESPALRLLLYKAVCNINCSIVFGERYEYTDDEFLHFMSLVDQLLQRHGIKNLRNFFPILQKLPQEKKAKETICVLKQLEAFVDKKIETARETFDASNIRSLVDLYIQNSQSKTDGEGVTEENVCHIVRDLFVAGSENVAIGVLWLVAYMTKYRDVQDRCRKCVNEALGERREITKADRENLVYVEATVNEVLRLANIAPLSVPHAVLEDVVMDGMTVPKDTMVLTHLQSVHMDPQYWPDPETFNPGRFIGEDGKLQAVEAFYPFSKGPRYCLAEKLARTELMVIFCSLLQHFRFDTAPDNPGPSLTCTQPGAFVEPDVFKFVFVQLEN